MLRLSIIVFRMYKTYFRVVTNSAFGFTLRKMVCLGFIKHPETIKGNPTLIDHRWLTDKKAVWTIDIVGRQVPATIHIHPPKIEVIGKDKDRSPSKPKPGHAPHVDLFKKENSSRM